MAFLDNRYESGNPLKGKAKGEKNAQEKKAVRPGSGKVIVEEGEGLWG